jgi:hypothetical protein
MDRSLAGLIAAQALFLVAGVGILVALRTWKSWADLIRALGLAYMLGISAVGVAATLVLVGGFGVGTPVVVALSLGICAAGLIAAALLRRERPRGLGFTRPHFGSLSLLGGTFALLTLVLLGALFRVARHQGLVAWDGWTFWVPKAKAIYFFGGLDEHLFRTLSNPSYPLLVPAVQAMDFHLMGSANATTLAVQYWFLLAGFVFAAWMLLRPLASSAVIWPFLALAVTMPELDKRILNAQADWPLDVLFAIAAICVARWLMTREPWLLGTYTVLMAGVMATKREGQLLALCLLLPLLAATWSSARFAWPRWIGLTALAYVLQIPWRIWWSSKGLTPDTPEVSFRRLPDHADRVLPAFRVVLALLFRYDLWLVSVPLAVAAALMLVARREYPLAVFYLGTSTLAVLGFVWILWSFLSFPLDESQQEPIPRAAGSLALLSIALAPLLVARVLASEAPVEAADAVPAASPTAA